jgi:carotenoid cleavage dioxygenase-like enzyme
MAHAMRGHGGARDAAVGRLARLHLDLRSGHARWVREDVSALEFAVFDPRSPGDRAATLYAPTTVGDAPMFNAVMALDARGRRRVHRLDAGVFAEEHLFVPRPGSSAPDDGWLVGTLLDSRHDRHGLAVFDARRVDAGPVAEAWLPYSMPLGFHGTFRAA